MEKQTKQSVKRIRAAIAKLVSNPPEGDIAPLQGYSDDRKRLRARMIDMLPSEDQRFAYEFVRKLVLAWDPDFTKVTQKEAARIKAAEESGFVDECEIDWDKIGK